MALDALIRGTAWALAVAHVGLWCVLASNLWYLHRYRRRASLDTLPTLSVLIPARNEAANLKRLLPSLLAQDHPAFEVIVYDDGSEDATWEVLQSVDDPRLTAVQGSGPPPGWVGKVHALYQATRRAAGSRYLFLDADAALNDASLTAREHGAQCHPDRPAVAARPPIPKHTAQRAQRAVLDDGRRRLSRTRAARSAP